MSMTIEQMMAGADLSQSLKEATSGLEILPLVRNYFDAGRRPKVNIKLHPHDLDGVAGDGWFHPSTHPNWSERALYEYLLNPEKLIGESPAMSSTLAQDFGSMSHLYIQAAMAEMKLLPKDLQQCHVCAPERRCTEPGVRDEVVGSRGHADGILALPRRPRGDTLFEFKSAGEWGGKKMMTLDHLDNEGFRAAWPDYYAQAQSYLHMSGRPRSIVLMVGLGFPFHMREFHIEYNRKFITEIWAKYARVRQAVADQRPCPCDCFRSERSKCAASRLCRG
jgi:hypothetical protein